ncbi:MAG: hypothetical protein ACK2UW_20755 [Anaerolineales bacterium]|jgi:hypothetical protein
MTNRPASPPPTAAAPQHPNSRTALYQRATRGQLNLGLVLTILIIHPALSFIFQTGAALILAALRFPDPWQLAIQWYGVYGVVVDILSLLVMFAMLRLENTRPGDLIGYQAERLPIDFLLSLVIFLVYIVLVFLTRWLLARVFLPGGIPPLLSGLPLWAVLFTALVRPIFLALASQLIYNGYSLPRLEVLFGSTPAAWLLVWLVWTLGAAVMPFAFNPAATFYQLFNMLPQALMMVSLYLVLRRIFPLFIGQWVGMAFINYVVAVLPLFG